MKSNPSLRIHGRRALVTAGALIIAASWLAWAADPQPPPAAPKKIEVITFGDLADDITEGNAFAINDTFIEAMAAEGLKKDVDYKLFFRSAQGDLAALPMLINSALDDEADLLMLLHSQTLVTGIKMNPPVPIVFGITATPFSFGLGKSDREHVPQATGTYNVYPVADLVDKIARCQPKPGRLGTLYMVGDLESTFLKDQLVKAATGAGIKVEALGYSTPEDIQPVAQQLAESEVQAFFVNWDGYFNRVFPTMVKIAREQDLPVFAVINDVDQIKSDACVMIANRETTEADSAMMAATARMVREIFDGRSPRDIPFENTGKFAPKFFYNHALAAKYGLKLPPEP